MIRISMIAVSVCCFLFIMPAKAQDTPKVDVGWLATNDLFVGPEDRWRTGSLSYSLTFGLPDSGPAPAQFGRVIELRFGGEVIAPESLANAAPDDRPFAGVLSLGLHTHFQRTVADFSVGLDLVFTGPQTGLDDFQENIHEIVNAAIISDATRANQIGDDFNPTLVVEAGRIFLVGDNARLRPFVEGRWGLETLVRVGFDLSIGGFGHGVLARDPFTGQRYELSAQDFRGWSLVIGGDIANVRDSELLPSSSGVQLNSTRTRLRAGLNYQWNSGSALFYGVTWLDEEFATQDEGQFVGSVRLRLKF
ncbi:MAG: lipid A-modifier LpxR family protein [Pseudomonadota bacterium]